MDSLLWIIIAIITAGAFYANYHFTNIPTPIAIIGWIFWLLISLGIALFTKKGKEAATFFKESRNEMRKVVWPSRQETVQTTLIVMVMVTITGFLLWGVDSGFMWLVGKLTRVSG